MSIDQKKNNKKLGDEKAFEPENEHVASTSVGNRGFTTLLLVNVDLRTPLQPPRAGSLSGNWFHKDRSPCLTHSDPPIEKKNIAQMVSGALLNWSAFHQLLNFFLATKCVNSF